MNSCKCPGKSTVFAHYPAGDKAHVMGFTEAALKRPRQLCEPSPFPVELDAALDPGSSSGRTWVFGTHYRGSNPLPGAPSPVRIVTRRVSRGGHGGRRPALDPAVQRAAPVHRDLQAAVVALAGVVPVGLGVVPLERRFRELTARGGADVLPGRSDRQYLPPHAPRPQPADRHGLDVPWPSTCASPQRTAVCSRRCSSVEDTAGREPTGRPSSSRRAAWRRSRCNRPLGSAVALPWRVRRLWRWGQRLGLEPGVVFQGLARLFHLVDPRGAGDEPYLGAEYLLDLPARLAREAQGDSLLANGGGVDCDHVLMLHEKKQLYGQARHVAGPCPNAEAGSGELRLVWVKQVPTSC